MREAHSQQQGDGRTVVFIGKDGQALHDQHPAKAPGPQPGGRRPASPEGDEEAIADLGVFLVDFNEICL
jgi:hypothetical protein